METSIKESVELKDNKKGEAVKVVDDKDVMNKDKLKDKIVRITGNGVTKLSLVELNLVSGISDFIETMDPSNKISPEQGADAQMGLYKTILKILSYESSKFKKLLRWVLDTVKISRDKKGAFDDKKVMRFHSSMNMSKNDLNTFRSLVNLLCVSADLRNKKVVVKRVSVTNIANSLKKNEAKNNLMNFYYS